MRRKLSYWALALLVPLSFVSCSQEEVAQQDEQEINLNITAGSVQTRVNTLGTGEQWEAGYSYALYAGRKEEVDLSTLTRTYTSDLSAYR